MADITPVTREEFYLAKAGGQEVPVPSAVTREEYYLEKLSNDSVVVPTPVTRREKFLYFACGGEIDLPSEDKMTRLERLIAKAGGMDVSTPTPVTREEQFWTNVEGGGWKVTEITGVLPLIFCSNGTTLINYRIFGTADGAGVQTENLFDRDAPYTLNYFLTSDGTENRGTDWGISDYIAIDGGMSYTAYNLIGNRTACCWYDENYEYISGERYRDVTEKTFDLPSNARYIRLTLRQSSPSNVDTLMLIKGTISPSEYIPFGYKLPLTLTSGTESKDTDIFIGGTKLLSDDYVDYESGKIYRAKRIHEDTVTIDGIEWDILDYDHDEVYKPDGTRAKHTVTIQTHECINSLQYSAKQAAFAFPNGLAAGTYHFTIGAQPWVAGDVGKVLTFTLSSAIPAGGQLVFNGAYNSTLVGTTISVFVSPTTTTAAETVTMIEGNTGTDLGTILRSKTETVNSIERVLLGSNNWLESAMRQYLNSDKAAGSVWTPQSVFDRPPIWAATTAGFLKGKSSNFVSHIGTAKKITGRNTISDGGGTATQDEKVFLLSRSEVYGGNEVAGGDGAAYSYYADYSDLSGAGGGADTNRIKYRNNAAQYWWLRSPFVSLAYCVRNANTTGSVGDSVANYSYGVAPACCIVLDDMDDWVKQTFYTEVDADLPALETFKGTNTLDSTETLGEVTIKGKIKET